MTIESNILKNVFQGNGVTVRFPFDFKIWEENQISITIEDSQGFTSAKEPDKVTISENGNGEVVLYLDSENKIPYPEGYKIAITRNMPFLQKSDYINGTRINTEVFEDDLDKAAAERQQLLEVLRRAVMVSATSDKTPEEILQDFLSRYYEIMEKYPEILEKWAECNNYKNLAKAWAESSESPDGKPESKSSKTWAGYSEGQAEISQEQATLARAWAQSDIPPDPDDPGSKSAKEWARIASDTVPLASHELAGKVKIGETVDVDGDGTIDISQNVLNNIERNGQNIAVLQAEKIDKSAISSAIDSVSEENVASSKAVSDLRNVLSDSFISGLGMPNLNKKIFIQFYPINNDKIDYSATYTAPANGWVTVYGQVANIASKAYALVFAQSGDIRMTSASGSADVICTATIPVSKGRGVYLKTQSCWSVGAYFFYAQGES